MRASTCGLLLGIAFVSSGCLSSRDVTVPSYDNKPVLQADKNGWYHFQTYWYRGALLDGLPQGHGDCRTQYAVPGKTETEWVNAPCEFTAGVRSDERHRLRAEQSLDRYREVRAERNENEREAQREAAIGEAYRRAESEASHRAFEESMQGVMRQAQRNNAATSAMLADVDRNTNAAYADTNRRLAKQAADRDLDRSVRETRTQQRAVDVQRSLERVAHSASQTRAQPQVTQNQSTPTQLPRAALYSKFVPGSATIVPTVGHAASQPKVVHGPEQLEAVAICWQSKNNSQHWRCDGPVQDTLLSDDSLEKQLGYAGCPTPRSNDGSRTIRGSKAMVYLCGFGLSGGDYDVVKKHGIVAQRNKYQCSGSKYEKNHCKENFQLTD